MKIARQTYRATTLALMLVWSTSVLPLTQVDRPFSQLVDLAEIILVGTVNDVSTEWGQGQLASSIFTVATLDNLDVLKGNVQGSTYDLRYAGGRIGDVIHHYEGMPRLTVGTRYVLFISSDTNLMFPVVGIGQGVFIVTRDSRGPTETIKTVDGHDVLGILDDRINTIGSGEPMTFDLFTICVEDQLMGIPSDFCRPAWLAEYYSSTEPGCDGTDSTVLLCDDIEDGGWIETCAGSGHSCCTGDPVCRANGAGSSNPNNDGWGGNIFSPEWPDPQGTSWARCGSKGAVGTDCAATSSEITPEPGGAVMGEHRFAPNQTEYDEIYVRYYLKQLSGFVMGHEKNLQLWDGGGGYLCCILHKYFGSGIMRMINKHRDEWLPQNQGNNIQLQNDRWYYIEVRVKLNTPGLSNGIFEMWIDDCGQDGLGCTGPGTLRAQHMNVDFRDTSSQNLGMVWVSNWGNPSSTGEQYLDQIYVATRRIGPM